MTTAGYIHDQRCPTNPEHGNARAMDFGMYCGHSAHTPPNPELWTQDRWTWSEWEDIKSQPNPDQPIATSSKKTRKPSARANRRRTR